MSILSATPSSPHDRRIVAVINAINVLEALNATDTPTLQMINVFKVLLQEIIAIRMSLTSLPLPAEFKSLDQ